MNNPSDQEFNYSVFESFFRGQRQEIKHRLSAYLLLITLLPLGDLHPALDIGCGRGEWLELLEDNGIECTGIDSNGEFVESCLHLKLTAEKADLFDFIPRQSMEKFSLITGFHLIEHISVEKQLWVLREMFRLLMPGGMVILETPNPENVTVGSCNFYIDPTHIRPLPHQLLYFYALQAGFASPMIARLNRHTVGAPLQLMRANKPGAARYNQLVELIAARLMQAPDYALIAFKPPGPTQAMLDTVAAINNSNDSFVLPASDKALKKKKGKRSDGRGSNKRKK